VPFLPQVSVAGIHLFRVWLAKLYEGVL
jgi:hypothetical protein